MTPIRSRKTLTVLTKDSGLENHPQDGPRCRRRIPGAAACQEYIYQSRFYRERCNLKLCLSPGQHLQDWIGPFWPSLINGFTAQGFDIVLAFTGFGDAAIPAGASSSITFTVGFKNGLMAYRVLGRLDHPRRSAPGSNRPYRHACC